MSCLKEILKGFLVKAMFNGVSFQYKGRSSKAAKNRSNNVSLNCNFCHYLKGFHSKEYIIAQNNSGWLPFLIVSFRLRTQNIQ